MKDQDKSLNNGEPKTPARHINAYALASQPSGIRSNRLVDHHDNCVEKAPLDPLPAAEPVSVKKTELTVVNSNNKPNVAGAEIVGRSALLSTPEVASYLNVSVSTLHRLRRTDHDFPKPLALPGRLTRWRPADIDNYIERRRIP